MDLKELIPVNFVMKVTTACTLWFLPFPLSDFYANLGHIT